MNTSQVNLLRGALAYASPTSGASKEKSQGVIIGVVTTLMATNKKVTFAKAIQIVKDGLPKDSTPDRLPDAWRHILQEN